MPAVKKIGVFTGTRAEYGLLYPVIRRLSETGGFGLNLYVSGSHLEEAYGRTIQEIEADGYPITAILPLPGLGKDLTGGTGAIIDAMGKVFQNPETRPDAVILLGDRYETLGVAVAAFLSNIPLGHIHGGDVVRGGMLDDSIRHAITKLSHLHFPVTRASADRILALGEEPWRVTVVGSPVIDNIQMVPILEKSFFVETFGLDPEKPWILFTQHPISTQPELAGPQALETLSALAALGEGIQVIATYPNHDEGSQDIIGILESRFAPQPQFRVVKSLGRINYLNILRYISAVAGNSSSGLLETAHFQVPCLNVGERQKGRERGENVVDVPQDQSAIENALRAVLYDTETRTRLKNGSHPFGNGECASRILSVLAETPFDFTLLNKQITY